MQEWILLELSDDCARSSGGAEIGAGDPDIKLGSSSLTCSFKGDLGEASKISGGWLEKSRGGSRATREGICDLSGKSSKTEEVGREEQK